MSNIANNCLSGSAHSEVPVKPVCPKARGESRLPALESAHAIAHAKQLARELGPAAVMLVNLSGRGDKDVNTVERELGAGTHTVERELGAGTQ